jgi:glycosyltransferase involved in cell wall biosynthesis
MDDDPGHEVFAVRWKAQDLCRPGSGLVCEAWQTCLSGAAMGANLRVAHVSNYDTKSANGVDKTVAGLISWLPRCGVQVEVWHLTMASTRIRECEVGGVRVVDLPTYGRPWNFLGGLTPRARQFVREQQRAVDLIHFHSVFIADHVWLAGKLQIPYLLTPNGGYSLSVLQGRHRWSKATWLRLREERYIRRAALLHAVSPLEREALLKRFSDVRVVYIPNAVDLPPLLDEGEDARRVSTKHLLFLGRLAVEHKGLDRLLHGYARFLEQTGDLETHLTLAGPGFRQGREVLEKLHRSLGISRRVSIREPVYGEAKWTLLRRAHIFAHPSRWEGMPFAVLEALAVGCPVLITPETNLGETVHSYDAGAVVAGTPKDIAQGLQSLLDTTGVCYAAMRQRARQLVEDHFTWPRVAGRMAQAYHEIMGGECMPDLRAFASVDGAP